LKKSGISFPERKSEMEDQGKSRASKKGEMRVVDCLKVSGNTYKLVTESSRHGRVEQKILVLRSSHGGSSVVKPRDGG
jgi:hypothetical protein